MPDNYIFNEKYLVWILRTEYTPLISSPNIANYLWAIELVIGKIKKIDGRKVKSVPQYESTVLILADDWIYIKRTLEGTDIESFRISYDKTQKDFLNASLNPKG